MSSEVLKQILQNMYIEPELLDNLSQDQKEILFSLMRQEQMKHYEKFLEDIGKHGIKHGLPEDEIVRPKKKKKQKHVSFLRGADDNEWVHVLGEDDDDPDVDYNGMSREEDEDTEDNSERDTSHAREDEDHKTMEATGCTSRDDSASIASDIAESIDSEVTVYPPEYKPNKTTIDDVKPEDVEKLAEAVAIAVSLPSKPRTESMDTSSISSTDTTSSSTGNNRPPSKPNSKTSSKPGKQLTPRKPILSLSSDYSTRLSNKKSSKG